MYITQYNVFDELSTVAYRALIRSSGLFRFQWVSVLSPGDSITAQERLYVCDFETLKTINCDNPENICILCVGDSTEIEAFAARMPEYNLIAVEADSVTMIHNMLQSAFNDLYRWAYQITSDIAGQAEIRTIVARAQAVFGRMPLLLVNSSYNILALSNTDAGGAENLQNLLNRGYYENEVTDALAKRGYFKYSYHAYSKPSLLDTPNFMGCPVLVTSIYSGHRFYGFIALYFTYGRQVTEGLKGLFKWYSQKLREYYLRCIGTEKPIHSQKEAFISDFLIQKKPDEAYLADRARALHIPLDLRYRVCVIKWKNYSRPQTEYIMWRLRHDHGFPTYRVLPYQDSLILLLNGDLTNISVQEKTAYSSQTLRNLLETDGGYAGFSLPGFPLFRINIAYRQATSAASLGLRLAPEEMLYFYSRYYVYELLNQYGNSLSLQDMGFWQLEALRGEKGEEYDNYRMIRTFLLTGRNITETARLMHMHRNSVIYRLKRICRDMLLDLNNPEVRLRLELSFRIQELLHGSLDPQMTTERATEFDDPLLLE